MFTNNGNDLFLQVNHRLSLVLNLFINVHEMM